MKKNFFILLFIGVHVCFLFLHIHRHMLYMKESFKKQKNEQLTNALKEKKETKTNDLFALQNRKNIQIFAEQELNFKPISLKQLHYHDTKS